MNTLVGIRWTVKQMNIIHMSSHWPDSSMAATCSSSSDEAITSPANLKEKAVPELWGLHIRNLLCVHGNQTWTAENTVEGILNQLGNCNYTWRRSNHLNMLELRCWEFIVQTCILNCAGGWGIENWVRLEPGIMYSQDRFYQEAGYMRPKLPKSYQGQPHGDHIIVTYPWYYEDRNDNTPVRHFS